MTPTELASWLDSLAGEVSRPEQILAGNAALAGAVQDVIARDIASDFAGSHAPSGEPWAPLRKAGRKPLVASGNLLASAVAMGKQASVEFTADGLKVSLDDGQVLAYGLFQDRGTASIPARPFIGISAEAVEEIVALVSERMGEEMVRRVMVWVGGNVAGWHGR